MQRKPNAAFNYGRPTVHAKPDVYLYKCKYNSDSDIARHLATASSTKGVANHYYVNAEFTEQTLALKQAFNDPKSKLYRLSATEA